MSDYEIMRKGFEEGYLKICPESALPRYGDGYNYIPTQSAWYWYKLGYIESTKVNNEN
jgi:hypothetical protein